MTSIRNLDEIIAVRQSEPIFRQNTDILLAEVSGEAVLTRTATQTCLELDEIGARVWTLLAKPRTFASLIDALMSEFDVDEEVCVANTEAFLQYLTEREFLIVSDGT
ncbi:MAG TPA: PqqD family protein [Rhizomicrobium sp.]